MNPQARFVKTDKGHDEIKNRSNKLEARSRQLLVMVDGGKPAEELLKTAKGIGGTPEMLLALLKDGFISEAGGGGEPVATPDAPPEKVYTAKAAMRRYIKMAAVEVKALNKAVDDVKTLADLSAAMAQIKHAFRSNGFDEAYENLKKEILAG